MEAVSASQFSFVPFLRPGDRIVVGQGTAEPCTLMWRLLEEARAGVLPEISIFVGPTYSDTFEAGVPATVRVESYCGIGGGTAQLAREGHLDLYPTHISALDNDIRAGRFRADVVLLPLRRMASGDGWNLGLARDFVYSAALRARVVIGELQPAMPASYGGDIFDDLSLSALVAAERKLVEVVMSEVDSVARAIANRIAGEIPDGAVIQMGVGTIPAAVCSALTKHRDLGVHSGAISDGIVDLFESGALTNARKERDAGVTVAGVLLGTRRLYDFVDGNPAVRLAGHDETHSQLVIAGLSRFHAINSALEVDLTGQIGSEIIGGRYLGAVGGQVDYIRAAQASCGGRAIIALPSKTGKGRSRIVMRVGTVTCSRADADTIVTEHGVAELRGQPIHERARRMIAIAAPEHREELLRDWSVMNGGRL